MGRRYENEGNALRIRAQDDGGAASEESGAEGVEGKIVGVDEGGGAADFGGVVGIGKGKQAMGKAVACAHFGEAAGGGFEDGAGFRGDGAELGEEGKGWAIDVCGDEEAAMRGDEAGQFAEAQGGGVAEVAVDEFEDDVVFVDDGLVAEFIGDVAEIGEAIEKEGAEAEGGFG